MHLPGSLMPPWTVSTSSCVGAACRGEAPLGTACLMRPREDLICSPFMFTGELMKPPVPLTSKEDASPSFCWK